LIAAWDFINVTNKYIVEQEPWRLGQDKADKSRLETVIYNLLEALRIIAILLSPFMPGSAEKIMDQLGIANKASQNFDSVRSWGGIGIVAQLMLCGRISISLKGGMLNKF
jgi:methionyl-tRNA synthetase